MIAYRSTFMPTAVEKDLGMLPGSHLAASSHLIAYRDDDNAAVCHCLTYFVFHGVSFGGDLFENHASCLFVPEGEARAADVCSWLFGVERHEDGEILGVLEPEVGGDHFQVL